MARGSGGIFDERAELRITNPEVIVMPLSRKGSIRVDPDIKDTVKGLIDGLAPMVGKAFDLHFMPYAEFMFRTWPVKTGKSKALLTVEYDVRGGGDELVAFLESGAVYTRWIHKGKQIRKMCEEGMKAANAIAAELERGP